MKLKKNSCLMFLFAVMFSACPKKSVTKEQLQNVKAGEVLIYRYRKADGRVWFYADKITRIEGAKIYFNPGKYETTEGYDDHRLNEFLMDVESAVSKEDLLKYATEQEQEKKVVKVYSE